MFLLKKRKIAIFRMRISKINANEEYLIDFQAIFHFNKNKNTLLNLCLRFKARVFLKNCLSEFSHKI